MLETASLPTDVATRTNQERRAWIRQVCQLAAFYRPLGETLSREATILDLSVAGVGFVCRQYFAPETYLMIEGDGNSAATPPMRLGRVVHARQAEKANHWIVGCAFVSRLSEEELRGWLE